MRQPCVSRHWAPRLVTNDLFTWVWTKSCVGTKYSRSRLMFVETWCLIVSYHIHNQARKGMIMNLLILRAWTISGQGNIHKSHSQSTAAHICCFCQGSEWVDLFSFLQWVSDTDRCGLQISGHWVCRTVAILQSLQNRNIGHWVWRTLSFPQLTFAVCHRSDKVSFCVHRSLQLTAHWVCRMLQNLIFCKMKTVYLWNLKPHVTQMYDSHLLVVCQRLEWVWVYYLYFRCCSQCCRGHQVCRIWLQ